MLGYDENCEPNTLRQSNAPQDCASYRAILLTVLSGLGYLAGGDGDRSVDRRTRTPGRQTVGDFENAERSKVARVDHDRRRALQSDVDGLQELAKVRRRRVGLRIRGTVDEKVSQPSEGETK